MDRLMRIVQSFNHWIRSKEREKRRDNPKICHVMIRHFIGSIFGLDSILPETFAVTHHYKNQLIISGIFFCLLTHTFIFIKLNDSTTST